MIYRNIVLVGFMGTGKSTVGKRIAGDLGWSFVDSDHEIERQEGRTIPELFAEYGELHFRDAESRILSALLKGERQVVSTGGGAVLREANRQAMLQGGLVVALRAGIDTIVARVKDDPNRPLLAGDVRAKAEALLQTRKTAYDFAELSIDTDNLSPADIAQRIAAYMEEKNAGG